MRIKTRWLYKAAFSISLVVAPTAALAQDSLPLIERTKLFGNPTKAGAQISPDGKWISFIAPRDGVLNVWVAPASDLSAAKPLTAERAALSAAASGRPIRGR